LGDTVVDDLRAALARDPAVNKFFTGLSGANRYAILYRIHSSKKPETRARNIEKFVAMLHEARRSTEPPPGVRRRVGAGLQGCVVQVHTAACVVSWRVQGLTKRCTNVSAMSATSRQPWSIVSEWPRPSIFTISVTPSLRFFRL
jgi:hypothetical protein